MKPGRELDALIAEHVMGLERITSLYLEIGWRPKGVPVGVHQLKPYSTDIAAAWEVVEKMGVLTWHIWKTLDDRFYAQFGKDQDEFHLKHTAEAGSAPHAICLAALKAVGHEVTK